ncbi:M3 family metallopeptidase [Subtercola boreus]|uniref:Peptidase M3 n=1 Tax=Subtercola boreus TaxID=120213 RepID=A0A3E0WCF2_9MICO|nr:M3 family metallopeptidase [Subtercola boreus]RFA22386.1 peptidase M3 [Subtercola boreus]RFA22448.1 peptidase M3 [Subtercola boreus]RFA28463.1 peptidase M3 [Subtercola boreus]
MSNPFLAPSTLPYGLPDFASIADEHYRPAFEQGMAEHTAEIEAILAVPDAATFDNTIVALERAGQTLGRVATVFYNRASADSSGFTDALEEELAPVLAAHADAIRLDARLYARVRAVSEAMGAGGDESRLDPESRYLVERHLAELTQAGAGLDETDKATLRAYNQQLSSLTTRFEKNLLADTNALAVVVDDVAELDGLDAGQISAAAGAARERGLAGMFVITLVLPTGHPYLASLTHRDLRERIMTASRSRGCRGGEHDNRALVLEITRLRAQRAGLLGFESHAAQVTSQQTAKTPEAVATMLGMLAPPAARNARAEQAALQRQAVLNGAGDDFELEAWDWAFYSEKERKARYDVDTAEMRPYFESERVLHDGVFWAATRLYGVTFTERTDLVAYHPEARVFEVRDEDGSGVGLYVLDLYTRDSKRGGAWMNSLISQNALLGHPVVVTNNLNVPKPAPGTPTLLTYSEVGTLFHEFGHALHGLFARVTYPKFAGTHVFRDFVEFPSQVNEMWMLWPEVLANYAVHVETGERMPAAFAQKLQDSASFNQGFETSEYLAAAMLDQAWHSVRAGAGAGEGNAPAPDAATGVAAFEAAALAAVGLDNPAVPTRYASTFFAHTFAGGYDAGYYSYIWSEVLDADTVEWFTENGGLTRENGDRFRARLLGVGGSKDPLEAYLDFRGRPAEIGSLLIRRGLDAPAG